MAFGAFEAFGAFKTRLSKHWRAAFSAALCAAFLPSTLLAAENTHCRDDAIIVFDSSGSMSQPTESGETRMDLARRAAHQVIPIAAKNRNLGLVIYGPGDQARCQKVSLQVAPQADAADEILKAIDETKTEGETPLSTAVDAAAASLDYTRKPAVIVLLTDGDENCGRYPCQLAHQLKAAAYKLTVHVIAFRLQPRSFRALSCLSRESGGLLLPANTMEQLIEALSQTLTCPQDTAEWPPIKEITITENIARSKSLLAPRSLCAKTRADQQAQCRRP